MAGLRKALNAALTDGKANGLSDRTINSGHAWSPGIVPGARQYPLLTSATPVPVMPVTDGLLIDVTGLNPDNAAKDPYLAPAIITDANGVANAAIPSGMTQGALGYFGKGHTPPYSLKSMGPAPQITLGGFIANGCHGIGWSQPTVSDYVCGIEVMTFQPVGGGGGTYEVTTLAFATSQSVAHAMAGQTLAPVQVSPAAMDALRVSLGSLGVITKLVIELETMPLVQALDEIGYVHAPDTPDVPGVFDSAENLSTLVRSCEYTEIFWFPFNDAYGTTTYTSTFTGGSADVRVYGNELWVKRFNEAPAGSSTQNTALVTDLIRDTSDLAKRFGGWLAWIMAHAGLVTPLINWGSFASLKRFMKSRIMKSLTFADDWSDDDATVDITTAYLYQLEYFTEIVDVSWAIPLPSSNGQPDFTNAIKGWNAVQHVIDEYAKPLIAKQFPANLTVHLRFVKNSRSLLSPANQEDSNTHTCFIEFLSFSNDLELFKEFTAKVVEEWCALGGLPHFAKAFQCAGADIYPEIRHRLSERNRLSDFQAYQSQFDPAGIFNNYLLDNLTGAGSTPVETTRRSNAPIAE